MKKHIVAFFVSALFLFPRISSALEVSEKPIERIGTLTTIILISTHSWTKVPTAKTLERGDGFKVVNYSSNTASFVGVISTATATPGEALNVFEIEIEPGENPLIPIGGNFNLFLRSMATSPEPARIKEVGQ